MTSVSGVHFSCRAFEAGGEVILKPHTLNSKPHEWSHSSRRLSRAAASAHTLRYSSACPDRRCAQRRRSPSVWPGSGTTLSYSRAAPKVALGSRSRSRTQSMARGSAVRYNISGSGHWFLVIGHWSLVIGHWSLVIGHWSVASGQRPVIHDTSRARSENKESPAWWQARTHSNATGAIHCELGLSVP